MIMSTLLVLTTLFSVLWSPGLAKEINEVCYEVVGCFNKTPPFDNAKGKLPQGPQVVQTEFHLATHQNRETPDLLDYTRPESITASNFSSDRPTKVIVHGLNDKVKAAWVVDMAKAFLDTGDFNVISIDWSHGAHLADYDQAVANVRLVATQLKIVLSQLQDLSGLKLEDVHFIGHSLGAQISGYAGMLLGGKIGRISGLDPAEPDFETQPSVVRLDRTDAMFVDVMHTNGLKYDGMIVGFGLMSACGHVDFYINGGKQQPGCEDGFGGIFQGLMDTFNELGDLANSVGERVACSHARAQKIFIESMTSACKFKSFPCTSFAKFQRGECLDCGDTGCSEAGLSAGNYTLARGKHYVTTFDDAPFCGGHYYHIQIKHWGAQVKTKGNIKLQLRGKNGMYTRQFSLFGRDTVEFGGQDVKAMVLLDKSVQELGEVDAIIAVYEKRTGTFGWFSHASETFILNSVEMVEVETGKKFATKKRAYTMSSGIKRMFTVQPVTSAATKS